MKTPEIAIPTVALAALMPILERLVRDGAMSGHERAMYLVLRGRLRGLAISMEASE